MTRTITPDDIRADNYGPLLGYWHVFVPGTDDNVLLPEYREIGRVPSIQCRCRPRELFDAVLIRHVESGEEFWLHVFNPGDPS